MNKSWWKFKTEWLYITIYYTLYRRDNHTYIAISVFIIPDTGGNHAEKMDPLTIQIKRNFWLMKWQNKKHWVMEEYFWSGKHWIYNKLCELWN